MNTSTVNIAFNKSILKLIDQVAKSESRSRSELIREAARMYIERKNRWQMIYDFGENVAKSKNLSEADVLSEIKEYRQNKKED
ncbi:MAG TPA: ribbon-helix-helix domain-containing protein [Candidatus Cloacimonadota bacterium]|nr:ribbon-helix-helix domain-containing protein [Candidatus Cloacimonadota bacterium]